MQKNMELFDYQKQIVEKSIDILSNHNGLGLFLGMGSGKTIISLEILKRLNAKRTLIVAPLFVCLNVWESEIDNFGYSFSVLNLRKNKKKYNIEDYDIVIVNYDMLKKFTVLHGKELQIFDFIILDESSYIKNSTSLRTKLVLKISSLIKYKIILTGTPNPNSYTELYPQIKVIDGGYRLGSTLTKFRNNFCYSDRFYNYYVFDDKKPKIINLINDIVISSSNIDNLPDVTYSYLYTAEKLSKKTINDFVDSLNITSFEELTISTLNSMYIKCLQLANGYLYYNDRVEHIHNYKLKLLLETLEIINTNTLICYYFKSDLQELEKVLNNYIVIQDSNSIELWNSGAYKIGLINYASSTAIGTNLQFGGSTLIWYTQTFSLEKYLQTNSRIIRPNQTTQVNIIHLYTSNSIDVEIKNAILKKNKDLKSLLKSVLIKDKE